MEKRRERKSEGGIERGKEREGEWRVRDREREGYIYVEKERESDGKHSPCMLYRAVDAS